MIEGIVSTISNTLALGGPVVGILLAISIFALALIALKFWQFFREGVGDHAHARNAVRTWQRGQQSDALSTVENRKSAVSNCVYLAIKLSVRGIADKKDIEEEIGRVALSRLHELQKGFRALEAIAQIAPLLGLFGTVLGMIQAFQNLQSAGNSVDPSILAGGIWVALLTTAVGLGVAMPVSMVLTWFETKIDDERVAIETLSSTVLNGNLLRQRRAAMAEESGGTASERLAHAH